LPIEAIYILMLVVGVIGLYSVAFAEVDCDVTVKCILLPIKNEVKLSW